MQPTGNLHLGNYLGAMVRWVGCSRPRVHLCVVLHAITMWQV
jgi:tryptophanyl-tRNA synthetase